MNSNILILIGIIIVDIVLFFEIIYFLIRRTISNKLIQAAFEKNDAKYESTANSLLGKFVSKFDKEFIKFNVASIQKNNDKVQEAINNFEKMNLRKYQKKKIYPKIFYHYIERNNKQEAKKYYELLSEFEVSKNKKDIDMTYDTYILNGHKYLDEALLKLNKVKAEELPTLEKMISKMYENKKINSEAKKYERLAQRHQLELEKKQRRK